jgi:hypothetical protein
MPAIRYGRPTINQTLTLLGMRGWSGGILVAVKKALTISITPAARSFPQDTIQPARAIAVITPTIIDSTVTAAQLLARYSALVSPIRKVRTKPAAPNPIIRPATLIRLAKRYFPSSVISYLLLFG